MKIEKVALFGAGAVGAYFIWGLSEKMGDNFMVVADGSRKKRLEQDGICINDRRYPLNVKTAEEAGEVDLILISTKYDALDEIREDVKKMTGEQTVILSVLNGVSSEQKIGEAVGMEHMMYSVMRIASVREGDSITFPPNRTAGMYYGEKDSAELTERALAIEELFADTEMKCHYMEDIMTCMWEKYASNISQNLPQAVLGVGNGAYHDSAHVYYIANVLWKEVVAVAKTQGVTLEEDIQLFRGVTQTARFSTLQDLDAGRHTEIEMLAGEMVKMGEKTGVSVPFCEYTYHAIKALEEKNDGKFQYI
jgi:2-dehydropantoate 2-reductase